MSIIDIVNAIRSEGSTDYQKYVPLATRSNITDVGNPIKQYQIFMNEFVNALINKIGLVVVRKRLLSNPLAPLKKGTMPLGFDVEEAHVNRATAEKFDPEGKSLLTRVTPDVAVMYHRLNRQDMYQVTVSKEQLGQAFTSWENLQKLLDGIISSMYDGDSDDEFILMKNLFAESVTNEHVVTSELPELTDANSATAIVKAFKNASTFMTFAGSSFNKFHEINAGENPRRLKTEKEDQVIILRADLATAIDVDVLANAFNMDKADFLAQRVIVDNFGSAENVGAFICDKNFVQVYDQQRLTEEFYNPAGLYYNYFYHVWQVVSYSTLVNALAFVFPEPEDPVVIPDTEVAIVSAVQDGGTTQSANSTGIVITFDKDVTGLTADHITLAAGTGSATKGALTGSAKVWTLAITEPTEGDVTILIDGLEGYAFPEEATTVGIFAAP